VDEAAPGASPLGQPTPVEASTHTQPPVIGQPSNQTTTIPTAHVTIPARAHEQAQLNVNLIPSSLLSPSSSHLSLHHQLKQERARRMAVEEMLVARDDRIRNLELRLLQSGGTIDGLRMRVTKLSADLAEVERQRHESLMARDTFWEDLGKASDLVSLRTRERDLARERWENLRMAIRSIPQLAESARESSVVSGRDRYHFEGRDKTEGSRYRTGSGHAGADNAGADHAGETITETGGSREMSWLAANVCQPQPQSLSGEDRSSL
jgi:hypothetical protein